MKKIDNFDEYEFLIETSMGYLLIKGSNLEIIKLDKKHKKILFFERPSKFSSFFKKYNKKNYIFLHNF